MLYHYDWPGNIPELMNTIQRYLATQPVALPGAQQGKSVKDLSPDAGLYDMIDSLERRMIVDALTRTKWRRGETAELLRIPRRSLQRKIQKYHLRPPG